MKPLIPLAALLLASCAHAPTYPATRAATLARASHEQVCGAVEKAHAAGVLTGQRFNLARGLCIQADDVLDAADAAVMGDRDTDALALVAKAQGLIEQIQKVAP